VHGGELTTRERPLELRSTIQLTLGGEVAGARLWGAAQSSIRRTPIALLPRADLESWTALAAATPRPDPGPTAREVLDVLQSRGAVFVQEIARLTRLPQASVEEGLGALVAAGRVTCDSFGGLRWLLVPGWRRRSAGLSSGRWSLIGTPATSDERLPVAQDEHAVMIARVLLRRTGVVFRRTVTRERIPVLWRDVARACRTLEARGEIRGGRFVAGFDGEQYALPEAVALLREVRRRGERPLGSTPLSVSASDPLNFQGILTPDEKVPASAGYAVAVG
jgi:ATP-dependent Lhr-like helicase